MIPQAGEAKYFGKFYANIQHDKLKITSLKCLLGKNSGICLDNKILLRNYGNMPKQS